MILISFISILSLSFFRLFIIFLYKSKSKLLLEGDGAHHFMRFSKCKEDINNRKYDQWILDDRETYYPILFHQICALIFPIKLIKMTPWLPSFVFFVLGGMCFYGLSLESIKHLGESIDIKLFSGLLIGLFCLSLNNLDFNGNKSNYIQFSERLLSKVCVGLYTLSLYLAMTIDLKYSLIALICSSLLFFISQFGRQAIVFFPIILSILSLNWVPLGVLFCAVLINLIIAPKVFVGSITGWLAYMNTYFRLMQRSVIKSRKSALSAWVTWSEIKKKYSSSLKGLVYYVLEKEPVHSIKVGASSIFIGYLVLKYSVVSIDPLLIKFLITPFIISTLIALKPLNFLGQSYRYIEYLLYYLPIYLLSLIYIQSPKQYVWDYVIYIMIVVIYVAFITMCYRHFQKNQKTNTYKVTQLLSNYNIEKDDIVLMIHLFDMQLLSILSGCKVVHFSTYLYYQDAVLFFESEKYPYIRKDFHGILKEYKVSKLIVDKEYLKESEIDYDFSSLKLDYENDDYYVYV